MKWTTKSFAFYHIFCISRCLGSFHAKLVSKCQRIKLFPNLFSNLFRISFLLLFFSFFRCLSVSDYATISKHLAAVYPTFSADLKTIGDTRFAFRENKIKQIQRHENGLKKVGRVRMQRANRIVNSIFWLNAIFDYWKRKIPNQIQTKLFLQIQFTVWIENWKIANNFIDSNWLTRFDLHNSRFVSTVCPSIILEKRFPLFEFSIVARAVASTFLLNDKFMSHRQRIWAIYFNKEATQNKKREFIFRLIFPGFREVSTNVVIMLDRFWSNWQMMLKTLSFYVPLTKSIWQ